AGYLAKDHWKAYLVTMLVAFVSVLPFIIYAEKHRKMKQVFIFCITLLALGEITLWLSGDHLWVIFVGLQLFFVAFNIMEAILPSLISKEGAGGYKGSAMGVYSTSQFIGVAIGGILGGWLYDVNGAAAVFIGGLLLTAIWLIVSLTMQQPPYVSSIRLELPSHFTDSTRLQALLASQPGVIDVVVVAQEYSVYLKVDRKATSREQLETV
ncbi:MFS transporter, partial [Providencia rettgeri]